MSNKEIASVFKLLSKVMEIHDENAFKTRSYSIAAFNIEKLDSPLEEMGADNINRIDGIGRAISKKILEILETGELSLLNSYVEQTPPGILEMLKLKGIGGKKIGKLWRDLEVEDMSDLLEACHQGQVAALKGFGKKTEENIAKALEYYLANREKFLYAQIEEEALHVQKLLLEQFDLEKVEFTGALRRKCIILDRMELIVVLKNKHKGTELTEAGFLDIKKEKNIFTGHTTLGTPITIYLTDPESFVRQLYLTTGSKIHLEQVAAKLIDYENEEAIYGSVGLPFIVPELREGRWEVEKARAGELPELVKEKDIKGVVHAHSTYSDGTASLRAMAEACIEMGYEYLAISDHSQTAIYASGLSTLQVKAQHQEIESLNKELAPFRIFKGIESDILNDGSLDYEEGILASFDFVIASIHSNLKMGEEKAMQRLLGAIQNPYTTLIGHPTGRILLSRKAYPVDHKLLIDACAEHHVSIEINANPYRLDMDWKWIQYAMEKGVMISVNPDAHSVNGIFDIHYGICAARKGGLTREMTLNAMGKDDFDNFLLRKRATV